MKKSVDDFLRSLEERKNKTLASQKPGNEKPGFNALSHEKKEKWADTNDFRFRDSVKDEKIISGHPDAKGYLTYIPTEKPW